MIHILNNNSINKAKQKDRLNILFVINTPPGINTYRRAINFYETLRYDSKYDVSYITKVDSPLEYVFDLIRHISKKKFDIIHVFEPFFPFLFLLPLVRIRCRMLIYDSGDIHHLVAKKSNYSPVAQLYFHIAELLSHIFSDKVIVRGHGAIETVSSLYNIPINKIKWIPDGVDLTKFEDANGALVRKKLNVADDLVLGYASSLRYLKIGNILKARGWELIDIARRTIDSGRVLFKILIVGAGPAEQYLKNLAIEKSVQEHFIFTGFVSDEEYPDFIDAMDVCFYESINDSSYIVMMPTKLVEYMACSKPIIAGNLGEAKRVFDRNGFLVHPLEPDFSNKEEYLCEITKAFIEFYDNHFLLMECGSRSIEIVKRSYVWSTLSADYKSFIQQLQ